MQELDPSIFTGPDMGAILWAYIPVIAVSVVVIILLIFRIGCLRCVPPDYHPRLVITVLGFAAGGAVLALSFLSASNVGMRDGVDQVLRGTSELILEPLQIFNDAPVRCPIVNMTEGTTGDITGVVDPFLQLYDSIFTSVLVLLITFLTNTAIMACWKPPQESCLARWTMVSVTAEVLVTGVVVLLVVLLVVLHTVGSMGITVCPQLDKLINVFNTTGIQAGVELLDRCNRNVSLDTEFLDAVSGLGFGCLTTNNTLFCTNKSLPCANVTELAPFEHFCSCTTFLADVARILTNCSGIVTVFEDYFCGCFLESVEVLYISTLAVIFSILLTMIFGKQNSKKQHS